MADNLTFDATFQDNVSPNLEKLERQLKEMGQSPVQIKMIIQAVDQATPKIDQAQRHIERMPKRHTIYIDVKSGLERFKDELHKFKQELLKPITVPFKFTDQAGKDLTGTGGPLDAISQVRSKIALPLVGSLPGANMLAGVGAGAGIAGAVTALSGIMQDSIKQNEQIEQAHQKLTVALRDNSGAVTETNKVIAASQKTPFTFQQNLQADVLGRSFQLPIWKGENPQVPQGYLKTAGNMASAMGTSPDEAMMALAMARQHMFRRLQPYGIRMTAQDFGGGGRYAGQSVDQALEIATRRFQGAMDAQMHTFSGMMSNIKDVISQQVIRPVGQSAFAALHQTTGRVEGALQDPGVQRKIGTAVEKVQHLTVEILQNLQKMKDYFEIHIKRPLEDIIGAVTKVGRAFAQAFGGATGTVIKTFSEALMSISTPLAEITKSVPFLGQMLGVMKAMNMMHMGGAVASLNTWKAALTPGSGVGIFTGFIKGLIQLPGTLSKLGAFFVLKGIADAHKASIDMNNQFKGMGDHLDKINSQVTEMADRLGESTTHMKNLVAEAAHGIDPRSRIAGPHSRQITKQERADLAEQVAQTSIKFQGITGMKPDQIVSAVTDEMKRTNEFSADALHKFGSQLIEVTAVAKDFGQTFDDVKRIMTTFAEPASRVGLGGLHGAPTLTALSATLNKLPVSVNQQEQGLYTPDAVMTQMLQQYGYPSIENLKTIPQGQLGQFWNFNNKPGAVKRFSQNEATYEEQSRAAAQVQGSARGAISRNAPTALQGQFAVQPVPVLWSQQHLGTDFSQFNKPGQSGVQTAERVRKEWERTVNLFADAQKEIAKYGAYVDQTQNYLEQLNKAQAAVNLQMQAFQHTITLAQRKMEDANLALQKYTLDNLRPLERELTRVQNAMEIVNHTMSEAQYNMGKFADGLLSGEQAALNQLHALQLYNEQLNYLKMQYTQIGSQLGQRTYERGYSARVQPLMGLSLEMQMERLQRQQQLKQSQYDLTYGEGHYQMQQAQRSLWQKTEMPLNTRLKGITENQKIIDQATIQSHQIGNVQFALQQKMFKVNEVIADQNDKIQKLQIHLTEMQQSKKMRQFEDEQYRLGQVIGTANQQLDRQNIILDGWKNTIDDLNQKKQDLQNLFDTLMTFHPLEGQDQFGAARKLIQEAGTTGLLPGGHWQSVNRGGTAGKTWAPGEEEKQLLGSIDKAQRDYNKAQQKLSEVWVNNAKRQDWKGLIIEAIKGAFTGDTWRKLGNELSKIPIIGGPLSTIVGGGVANLAPILGTIAVSLAGLGALGWALKRAALPVAARTLGLAGGLVDRGLGLAGIESNIGGKLKGTVEFLGTKFADKVKITLPEAIAKKFEPFLHPLKNFRANSFKIIGATIGAALTGGHPLGAMGGIWAGGKLEKLLYGTEKKVAQEGEKIATESGKVRTAINKHLGPVVERAKAKVGEVADGEGRLSSAINKVKDTVEKDLGPVVDRANAEIGKLGGAARDASNALRGKVPHPPGTHPAAARRTAAASTVSSARAAAEDASKHPRLGTAVGKITSAARTALPEGLLKALRLGGKVGGPVLGALNFVPAALDFKEGHIRKGILEGIQGALSFTPQGMAAGILEQFIHFAPPNPAMSALSHVSGPAGSQGLLGLNTKQGPSIGNIYANQYVQLENFIKKSTHLTSAQRAKDLKALQQFKIKTEKVNMQANSLDSTEKAKYLALDHQHQIEAQQAALTGPNGLKNYLDQRVLLTQKGYIIENQKTDEGLKDIQKTIEWWQKQLGQQISDWWTSLTKNMTTAQKKGPAGATASVIANAGGGTQALLTGITSGGFFSGHAVGGLIHGLNNSQGHLIRAGEEGDEMIIPLAPHRRSRAKSLLNQTRGIVGYAQGGWVKGGGHGDSQIMNDNIHTDPMFVGLEKSFKETSAALQSIEKHIKDMNKLIKETKDAQEKKKDTEILAKLNTQLRDTNKTREDAQKQYNRAVAHNIFAAGDLTGGESTLAGVTTEKQIRRRLGKGAAGERKYIEGAALRGVNANLLRDVVGHGLNKAQQTAYERLERAIAPSAHTSREQLAKLEKALDTSLGGPKHVADVKATTQWQKQSNYQDKHISHMTRVESMLERLVSKDTVVHVNNQVSGGAQVHTTQTTGRRKAK